MPTRRLLAWLLAATTLLATLVLAAAPRAARASDDYSIDRVDIDATVDNTGTVSVKEMREYDFDGDFHGVYWKIPTGELNGNEVSALVDEVGAFDRNGNFQSFSESDSGQDGTYTITEYPNYVKVKIYSAHSDESVRFVINYSYSYLATRYADTSELYWKFVSDGWDRPSENVTCTVHLPVPAGETVNPGDNVRAWGHGPLDATVNFDGNDIVYNVPGVGTDEFAECRIVFPSEWLSLTPEYSSNRLDTILSEEQKWADEANARRERARLIQNVFAGIGAAVCVLTIILCVVKRRAYKASHRPLFDDKYFRDVPTNDHPAVLGVLYNDGSAKESDLTASLMRLTDLGVIRLDLIKSRRKGFLGTDKVDEDYRVVQQKDLSNDREHDGSYEIDDRTLHFIFGSLAPLGKRKSDDGVKSALYFSELESIAKKHPSTYSNGYDSWKGTVEGVAEGRGFFVDETPTGKGALGAMLTLNILGAIACVFGLVFELVNWSVAVPVLAGNIVSFVIGCWTIGSMDDLSREAIEVKAKLEALKRWLEDFTRLEEAVPNDVVLWNKLLVMAVVLGVSEEVIEQLRMAAPQVLEDPDIMPVYGWYYAHSVLGSPMHSFDSLAASAHHVSSAALASSSSSSGGGFGGGFSGGGGGGCGGGGGGGAF